MKNFILVSLMCLLLNSVCAQQTTYLLNGEVVDKQSGEPLPGVNLIIKGKMIGTVTDEEGRFELDLPNGPSTLKASYIGYVSQEIELNIPASGTLRIQLEEDFHSLQEFQVVSTGFQELSPERTTGSFVKLDEELITRRVTENLLERFADVTPGLLVVNDGFSTNQEPTITIRGNSTILAENQPLIVVDNLAYDGSLNSINPNDVESITILKDAAAASIWGAKAGNGVIVITTKKGRAGQGMKVSLNTNVTWGQQSDAFYTPQMQIGGFVDQEVKLFQKGYYAGRVTAYNKPRLSPVVETLLQHESGEISDAELQQALQVYKSQDVRNDLEKYFYRPSLHQQYALGISGGSDVYTYSFSAGWDDTKGDRVTEYNSRLTLSSNQNWSLLNRKLDVGVGTYFSLATSESALPGISNFFAYDILGDEMGNPLPVSQSFSDRFKESVSPMGLLNWNYVPLEEIGLSPKNSSSNDLRINANLGYQLLPGLKASVLYQYWTNSYFNSTLQPLEAYTTRELINDFTSQDEQGNLMHAVPVGGILDEAKNRSYSHTLRAQLSWDKEFSESHLLNLLGGVELKDQQSNGSAYRSYGYDEKIGVSQPVDYVNYYPRLSTGFQSSISFQDDFSGTVNRYLSAYVNAGYTWKHKYLLNASGRVDKSNLFGVNTNQKTVPLWSAGFGWIASEEQFLSTSWLSFLKLRATYGYNGNTNTEATAYTTAYYYGAGYNNLVGQPFLGVLTPPNPELRWERIKIINLGLDYKLFDGKWFGSLDLYKKTGEDLLGPLSVYPSSGFNSAVLNYASTSTNGMDLSLNYRLAKGEFSWTSSFIYSVVKEKVTDYENEPTPSQIMGSQPGAEVPVLGKPLHYIYSYPWAGLNPDTGAPMGLMEGSASEDYQAILQLPEEDLIYHGSSRPTSFGAFRNQFDWKGWNLSFNITYRLGYYFRDLSVNYDEVNRGNISHSDYDQRWQALGDQTFIPSDPNAVNRQRNSFYLRSSALVEKGDHIRFQDIRVGYDFAMPRFEKFQVYGYLNNLGLIWKASDRVNDPDHRYSNLPRTVALGLSFTF
ncbi:SusC/RagA family TonB-linked outer membrane protein [Algoriphagus sp. C2-6-M1]|uniref:SusC/RagA family TonB-linked outer membrane protein n=1 Tax=Algoriphagus persicinus TaxID=3108754 RepID=UPI002B3ADE10|nr:SusC/RagA family TonB-linked outer membrane protein [Algoriphagus sp. C2-6-M1]MEB2782677.1 SusC/RagA family TonB-linked outer membrane protein [Algoriphagus sp. C2-6-M1]